MRKLETVNSRTKEYYIWMSMRMRCSNPKNKAYKNYGGRGITVCPRWLASFDNFYRDMGPKPDCKTLDRKNNDSDYSPENCEWADWFQQHNNTRNNRPITFNGKTLNLGQWESQLGFTHGRIRYRLNSGWSVEKALTTKDGRSK